MPRRCVGKKRKWKYTRQDTRSSSLLHSGEESASVCVSLSKQCGGLQYLREVMGRLGVEKSGNQTVISKQSLWGVIEGVTRVRVIRS